MLAAAGRDEQTLLIESRFAAAIGLEWESARRLQVTLINMSLADARRDAKTAVRRVGDVEIHYFVTTAGKIVDLS